MTNTSVDQYQVSYIQWWHILPCNQHLVLLLVSLLVSVVTLYIHFLPILLCPLECMIIGYRITEFVLFWIIFINLKPRHICIYLTYSVCWICCLNCSLFFAIQNSFVYMPVLFPVTQVMIEEWYPYVREKLWVNKQKPPRITQKCTPKEVHNKPLKQIPCLCISTYTDLIMNCVYYL